MPKVGKHNIKYCGNWIAVEVWYKDGSFSLKNVPDEWLTLGDFSNSNRFESNLINDAEQAAKKAEKAKEQTDLVLLIRFRVSDELAYKYEDRPNGGRSGMNTGEFPAAFTSLMESKIPGHGFSFEWIKMFRTTAGDKRTYFSVTHVGDELKVGHQRQVDEDKQIIMPYTPEREAFFIGMAQATKRLALQISKFLSSDDLAAMIDAGGNPMLLSKNENTF